MKNIAVFVAILAFANVLVVTFAQYSDLPPQCPWSSCDIVCQNGYAIDENGCETCTCRVTEVTTEKNEKIESPKPVIPKPKPEWCVKFCQYGNAYDKNACHICECIPHSELIKPDCPPRCAKFCQYRNVVDKEGCETCECSPKLTYIPPSTPPPSTPPPSTPPPLSTLKPDCPPRCAKFCQYRNVVDIEGCETCECSSKLTYLPPSTPPPKSTLAPLQSTPPTLSTLITDCPPSCAKFCQYRNVVDKEGCETCECSPKLTYLPPSTYLI